MAAAWLTESVGAAAAALMNMEDALGNMGSTAASGGMRSILRVGGGHTSIGVYSMISI
jgi:hypothetical protein